MRAAAPKSLSMCARFLTVSVWSRCVSLPKLQMREALIQRLLSSVNTCCSTNGTQKSTKTVLTMAAILWGQRWIWIRQQKVYLLQIPNMRSFGGNLDSLTIYIYIYFFFQSKEDDVLIVHIIVTEGKQINKSCRLCSPPLAKWHCCYFIIITHGQVRSSNRLWYQS